MKNQLRDDILEKRNSLPKEEVIDKSRNIEEKLFNLDSYKKSRTVMLFVSFNNEVHTHDIIKKSLGKKNVVIPKVMQQEIEPSVIIDFDNLIPAGIRLSKSIITEGSISCCITFGITTFFFPKDFLIISCV